MKVLPIVVLGASYVKKASGVKVLDYGAGGGRNSIYLAEQGYEVLAVDRNKEFLKSIPKCENLKTECVDVTKWEISGNFDYVVVTNILHFFESDVASKCMKKIVNATAPDGIIAFTYILDDKKEVPDNLARILRENYREIESETKIVHDKGHLGMSQPHEHRIFYFLGQKVRR